MCALTVHLKPGMESADLEAARLQPDLEGGARSAVTPPAPLLAVGVAALASGRISLPRVGRSYGRHFPHRGVPRAGARPIKRSRNSVGGVQEAETMQGVARAERSRRF